MNQELEKQKQEKKHQEMQSKAQTILLNKIAEDYILSKDVSKEEKDTFISLYELYNENYNTYEKDEKFVFNGDVYNVIQKHQSEPWYQPNELQSLYTLFYQASTSDGVDIIPEWKEPVGDTIMHDTGALVTYNGKIWESIIDNNVWRPGEYGWVEYKV